VLFDKESEAAANRAKVEVAVELETDRLDAWEQELEAREARLQKKEGELESYVARAQGELGKREAALRVVNS